MATDPYWPYQHPPLSVQGQFERRHPSFGMTPGDFVESVKRWGGDVPVPQSPMANANNNVKGVGPVAMSRRGEAPAASAEPLMFDPADYNAGPRREQGAYQPTSANFTVEQPPVRTKEFGLTRVVKQADGSYTNLPDAQGEERFYDVMGNRADRGSTVGRKGQFLDEDTVNRERYASVGRGLRGEGMKRRTGNPTVAAWYAAQNGAPSLSAAEIEANGKAAMAVAERNARLNAPKISAADAKLLAETRKIDAETGNLAAEELRRNSAEMRAIADSQSQIAARGLEGKIKGATETRAGFDHDEKQRIALDAEFARRAAEVGPEAAIEQMYAENIPVHEIGAANALMAADAQRIAQRMNEGAGFAEQYLAGTGGFWDWNDEKTVDPTKLGRFDYRDVEIRPLPNQRGISKLGDWLRGRQSVQVFNPETGAYYIEDDPEIIATINARKAARMRTEGK